MKPWDNDGTFWCWLLGHDWKDNPDCARCGMPWGYDYIPNSPYILERFRVWHWNLFGFRLRCWQLEHFSRCCDCGKWEYFFGRKVGNHDECLPF